MKFSDKILKSVSGEKNEIKIRGTPDEEKCVVSIPFES